MLEAGKRRVEASVRLLPGGRCHVLVEGRSLEFIARRMGQDLELVTAAGSQRFPLTARPTTALRTPSPPSNRLASPMAGRLVRLLVAPGDRVPPGGAVAVVEAMKMENELHSPGGGIVAELPFALGANIERGAIVAVFQPEREDSVAGLQG